MTFSPASKAFLAAVPEKVLNDEEKAKKLAAEERKKGVELLMSYQEKLHGIAKLESEIYEAKLAAMTASPAFFNSPGLNLGVDGWRNLMSQGGAPLADAQQRLAAWLQMQEPELAGMSDERRRFVTMYQRLDADLRRAKEQATHLAERNELLERVIAQQRLNELDHLDDGADSLYEEALRGRRRRSHTLPRYRHHDPYQSYHERDYLPGPMSPEFERARHADRYDRYHLPHPHSRHY